MSAISPARKAAFGILLAIGRGKAHSDELLHGRAIDALSSADRNLATALVLGVLRWQIGLDEQLKGLLRKPGAKLDPEVLIALRMGAFQLFFLDRVPAHAAIDNSVELAKQSGHRFASGMVNAVLRKLGAPGAKASELFRDELAALQAHPAWMVERWTKFYGLEAARAICRHGQAQAPLTVHVEGSAVEAELTQAGIRLEPGALLAAARTVASGDVPSKATFREGCVRMQDEGSQLIGEIAARAGEVRGQKTATILDACAAPGGKTLILAERNPEARILACEASPRRLAELRERLAAYAGRVECRLADATALKEESAFDLVLVDVPCSGTGTLDRNPEIRHRLRLEDLVRQAQRQRDLLRAAVRCARPGGHVVYATCSLEPEENEQVVGAVLQENHNCRLISLASAIESLQHRGTLIPSGAKRLANCLTPEGALRMLPGAVPTDGFFVALIERTE
ncbi:MAG: transcription antitermination factor NusB [Terracidiphilus sp.]